MSFKQQIQVLQAPVIMPDLLSQAIVHNNTIYCSGAVGIVPSTGKVVERSVRDRTQQWIRNLSAILSAAGSNFEYVTKANVFLSYMLLLVPTNEVYKTYWGDIKPGRTCVAVKQLPLGMDEETGCMGGCVRPKSSKL